MRELLDEDGVKWLSRASLKERISLWYSRWVYYGALTSRGFWYRSLTDMELLREDKHGVSCLV